MDGQFGVGRMEENTGIGRVGTGRLRPVLSIAAGFPDLGSWAHCPLKMLCEHIRCESTVARSLAVSDKNRSLDATREIEHIISGRPGRARFRRSKTLPHRYHPHSLNPDRLGKSVLRKMSVKHKQGAWREFETGKTYI